MDVEPKSSQDFVKNLQLLDSMDESIGDLRERIEFVDRLFSLMGQYMIPLTTEDSGLLTTIKTQLGKSKAIVKSQRHCEKQHRKKTHNIEDS